MRDPERIDRILTKLAVEWKKNPDWRLGQLFANLIGDLHHRDAFFVEDYEVENGLDRLVKK